MDPREDTSAVARAWCEKAGGDLQAARACFASEAVPGWIVGFHLQQAAEKTLKGLLVLAGQEPPRSHALARLDHLLAEASIASPLSPEDIQGLQPFAIEERYPILSPVPVAREELAHLIEAVARAVAVLEGALPTA